MSSTSIGDLPTVTTLDGTELIAVTEDGTTYQMTLENFVVSMGGPTGPDPTGCSSIWMNNQYKVLHPDYAADGVLITTSPALTLASNRYSYSQLASFPDYPGDGASFRMSNITSAQTYTFSEPVTNPLCAFYSIGQPARRVIITSSVTPYDYGGGAVSPSYPGGFAVDSASKTITGWEGFGMVSFPGTHTSITLTPDVAEHYYDLVWGIRYCP